MITASASYVLGSQSTCLNVGFYVWNHFAGISKNLCLVITLTQFGFRKHRSRPTPRMRPSGDQPSQSRHTPTRKGTRPRRDGTRLSRGSSSCLRPKDEPGLGACMPTRPGATVWPMHGTNSIEIVLESPQSQTHSMLPWRHILC